MTEVVLLVDAEDTSLFGSKAVGLGQAVRDAVALQRGGRSDEAEAIYAAVLAVDDGNFDSLHNLSLIRRQQGRLSESLSLVLRARDANPSSAQVNDSLGHSAGDFDQDDVTSLPLRRDGRRGKHARISKKVNETEGRGADSSH